MDQTLARNWWAVGLRGVLAILFGLLAFFMPGIALLSLVLLFGAYSLVDGVIAIVSGIRHRKEESHWWVLVLEGLVGVIVGIVAFALPPATALALVFVIAAWAIVTGVLEMTAAVRLRKEIKGEWLLFLTGLLSVVVGLGMGIFPGAAALALVWVIASYAIVFGVLMIALAFRLRGWQHHAEPKPSSPSSAAHA